MELEDKFHIKGKGIVITARLGDEEPLPEIGSGIVYKGVPYIIRSIERFNKPMSIPIPSNNIGMIVAEAALQPGEIFWLGEPKYVGAFPPREDVQCKPKEEKP